MRLRQGCLTRPRVCSSSSACGLSSTALCPWCVRWRASICFVSCDVRPRPRSRSRAGPRPSMTISNSLQIVSSFSERIASIVAGKAFVAPLFDALWLVFAKTCWIHVRFRFECGGLSWPRSSRTYASLIALCHGYLHLRHIGTRTPSLARQTRPGAPRHVPRFNASGLRNSRNA